MLTVTFAIILCNAYTTLLECSRLSRYWEFLPLLEQRISSPQKRLWNFSGLLLITSTAQKIRYMMDWVWMGMLLCDIMKSLVVGLLFKHHIGQVSHLIRVSIPFLTWKCFPSVQIAENWNQRSPRSGEGICFGGMVIVAIYRGFPEGFFPSSSIVSSRTELPESYIAFVVFKRCA